MDNNGNLQTSEKRNGRFSFSHMLVFPTIHFIYLFKRKDFIPSAKKNSPHYVNPISAALLSL